MCNNKDILAGALCYPIGPMEFVPDHGILWRKELKKELEKNNLKIKLLDPTNKVASLKKEVDEEKVKISNLKEGGYFDELSDVMKTITRQDLRCLDLSDLVIAYVDTSHHMCGSYFELTFSSLQKKPYFLIIKGGKRKAPSWLFGIFDHSKIFSSVKEVVERLKRLDCGCDPLDDKWVLIRKEIDKL